MDLTEIFYHTDEFCINFEKTLAKFSLETEIIRKQRSSRKLVSSEVLTILIYFHLSKVKTFKDFYNGTVKMLYTRAFPNLPSYNRFVELMQDYALYTYAFMVFRFGKSTGTGFIDSTPLKVCHNRRIYSHRVFKGVAQRGKSSMGWFYGFKLHFTINEQGKILGVALTSGNVADNNQSIVDLITQNMHGKLFGDKGYISSSLFKNLFAKGLHLVTKVKKNMKNKLMNMQDKLMLKKRGIIESVIDLLKNSCTIDHTRHRSKTNFLVNLFSGLVAYSFFDRTPSIRTYNKEINA